MSKVLLDTNILILHIAADPAFSFRTREAAVSALTVFEALRFPGMSDAEERSLSSLLADCEILPVTDSIARRAAVLGRNHRGKPVDLLIAATAIEHCLPLITKNTKDFRHVRGLEVRFEE